MSQPMSQSELIQYVDQQAPQLGLDPAAVLAVASQEGLSGGIGDTQLGPGSFSVGPWQLYSKGALPANIASQGATAAQAWAWSKEGVDYALQQIAGVAKGLSGQQAVATIVNQFERPAAELVAGEIARADAALSQFLLDTPTPTPSPTGTPTPTPEPSPTPGSGSSGSGSSGSGPTGPDYSGCQDWQIAGATLSGTRAFCIAGTWLQAGGGWKILFTLAAALLIIGGAVLYFKGELPVAAADLINKGKG